VHACLSRLHPGPATFCSVCRQRDSGWMGVLGGKRKIELSVD